jgi:hypothetical protein
MSSPAGSRQPGPITDWAGRLTLMGSEVAYVGLAAYLAWITFAAEAHRAPSVSATVSGATGALAAAFGVAYATVIDAEAAHGRAAAVGLVAESRLSALANAIGRMFRSSTCSARECCCTCWPACCSVSRM